MHGESPAPTSDADGMYEDSSRPAVRRAPLRAWQLAAVGVTVAIVRWGFLRDRRSFHLAPDEPGQLAMARWIGGGPHWNMFDHSTWRPGAATLFSVAYWFTDDGTTAVRAALTINALLAGLSAVVLALLLQRLTPLPRPALAVVSLLVALAPAVVMSSAFVWAESLATLTFLLTVWHLVRFHDTGGSLRQACAAVAWSIAGFTTHSRLLPVIATTVVLAAGTLAWRHRWRAAAAVGAFGLVGTAASTAYARLVRAAVWEQPGAINTTGTVVERLDDPAAVADAFVGQMWYQLVATAGMISLGAFAIARAALPRPSRPDGPHSDTPGITPWIARAIALSTLAPLAVAATFMSNRDRADQLVYGRYDDAVLWLVVALGLAWLVERAIEGLGPGDLWVVAGVPVSFAALGTWVQVAHGNVLDHDIGLRQMVAGLLPYVGADDAVPVIRITLTAFAIFVLAATLAGGYGTARAASRPQLLGAAVAITVVMGSIVMIADVRTRRAQSLRLNTWARAEVVTEIDGIIPPDAPIGVNMVPDSLYPAMSWERQRQRYQLYQLYLPGHRFERDRGIDDGVGPYVFAPAGDPTLTRAGATVLWTEPGEKIALWLEPTPE